MHGEVWISGALELAVVDVAAFARRESGGAEGEYIGITMRTESRPELVVWCRRHESRMFFAQNIRVD